MLDRLLDQALEQLPEKREEFARRCRARAPRLGFWLQRLLLASSEPTGFLDRDARHLASQALAERTDPFPKTLVQGTRLGPWRILARIGAGGMGEVYKAERADGAFEMSVAIKLIRSRKKDLARLLESERQLLARLNHASIARLIDGGMADDERPYLVMEWVDGRTLDEWMREETISPERCLAVFSEVCEAVAFAHRSLVVHGDIKPANLAIGRDGQVRLLDFGVAQLLDDEGEDRLPSALTPGFAAPEQLNGEPVSTASDIFSLGALLHWLVFGHAPGQKKGPPVPRKTWSTFRRLADLEAIINRATARNPEDRFATVNALILELKRLQQDFPIKSRPLPPTARISFWVRRHKVAAALGSLAIVIVFAGISTVLWQASIVAQERDVARHEAALSLAIKDHLVLLFREVSSLTGDAEELTAREMLDATAEAASDWLRDDPDARAEIQLAIAEILISLDDYASAEPLLERILEQVGDQGSPTLLAKLYRNMALVLHRRGEIEAGFELADLAVRMIEAFSGDHRERLSDALQMRGRLARDLGNWPDAIKDLQKARQMAQQVAEGPRPILARAEANLAATYVMGNEFNLAVQHMEAAEALWYALGRGESPDALANMQNLAVVLDRLGRLDEAEQRFRQSIQVRKDRLGDSSALAAAKLQYARMLVVRGGFDEAERLMQRAGQMMMRFVGSDSPDYASTRFARGELARARGDLELAQQEFRHALEVFEQTLGSRHPFTMMADSQRMAVEHEAGLNDAIGPYGELIDRLGEASPATRALLAQLHCERSAWNVELGNYQLAEADASACREMRQSLALGGWRIKEAELLAQLAVARSGSDELAVPITEALLRLGDSMGQTHSRYRWFVDQVESLP
jgi:eukaryotic-like serine/threonine-protein kinase